MHISAKPRSTLSVTVTALVWSGCQRLWCHSHIPASSSCT